MQVPHGIPGSCSRLTPPVLLSGLAHPFLALGPVSCLPHAQDAQLYAQPGCHHHGRVGKGKECAWALGSCSRKTQPESSCPGPPRAPLAGAPPRTHGHLLLLRSSQLSAWPSTQVLLEEAGNLSVVLDLCPTPSALRLAGHKILATPPPLR